MTESSRFWDGTVLGDATEAPYDASEFSEYMSLILTGYDRTRKGVIFTKRSPYTGLLKVTNPSGTAIRVASGAAIVDGSLYLNDGNVDLDIGNPPSAIKNYYVTITKDWDGSYNGTAQTIRAKLYERANPGAAPYADPYYIRGDRCEILLAYITYTAGGTITIIDEMRNYINMDFVWEDDVAAAPKGTGRFMCGHDTATFAGVLSYVDVEIQLDENTMYDKFRSMRGWGEIVDNTDKYYVKYYADDYVNYTVTFRVQTVDSTVPGASTEVDFNWIVLNTYRS